MSTVSVQTQSSVIGGGFLSDPFLELTGSVTTPAIQKSNRTDLTCVSNGALVGSIIGTLLLSLLVGFLTWLVYLRPKFRELHEKYSHQDSKSAHAQLQPFVVSSSLTLERKKKADDEYKANPFPLDITAQKFGTFPFRHSQTSSLNSHYYRIDGLHRNSASFRSVNIDKDFEMVDVELLDPKFGGLNFSITGNMRAGIYIKEMLDKNSSEVQTKANTLRIGDRIMALTVCFDSIVYEDALTILSYASPYPVILRIQRPSNGTKVNVITENRSMVPNTTPSKVKWQDDFDHYDNDTPLNRSVAQKNPPLPMPITVLPSTPKQNRPPLTPQTRSSAKKVRRNANTQPRMANKFSPSNKGNRIKTSSNSVFAASGATTKRSNNNLRKYRSKIQDNQSTLPNQIMLMSTGLTGKLPRKTTSTTPLTNKRSVKTVTDAVNTYLRHKNDAPGVIEPPTELNENLETTNTPYYDSPYDYFNEDPILQYQYLHQSHVKQTNHGLGTESLTAITPN
ncbi:unnamed protein product [Adineta ricciae]|uniref:PDZ domain-containing protein n=1 Tax=Adineta ricciae TaxID=249248 RepID=A0A814E8D5_ADIRI|nr:unnamed protein product [Adineta ricciae]